jgi:regulator of replication initiation timing
MQQVTNLLKELKNNSSGGYTSHATTNHLPQDDKSLKV